MNKRTHIFFIAVAVIVVAILCLLKVRHFNLAYMDWADIASLLFSGIAIAVSLITFSRTQKTSAMPVLVFVKKSETIWHIQNAGKGPAIRVMIADKNDKGEWSPIIFSPIADGASINLDILKQQSDFAAVYTDINGDFYSSLCINNINSFYEKNYFPEWKTHFTEWQRREMREKMRRSF